MADYETVNVRRDGAAATIELNRPETLNAWNAQFGHDLLAAVARGRARTTTCAPCCITGAGPRRSPRAPTYATSAAARSARPRATPTCARSLTERYHPIITTIRDDAQAGRRGRQRPGGRASGCSLALAADLIVAAESAYFLLAFVNIGLVPDGGSSLLRPRRASGSRARPRWRCSASASRPPQALEWGLINRVVPDDDFAAEADALRRPPGRRADALLRRHQAPAQRTGSTRGMDEQLELEADIQQEMAGSAGLRRGRRGVRRRSATPAFGGGEPRHLRRRRPPSCE